MSNDLTVADLTARVRRLTGIRMETVWTDADIADVINDAYTELCDLDRWEFLKADSAFQTTPGEGVYDLSLGLREIEVVALSGRYRDQPEGPMEWDERGGGTLQPRSARSRDELEVAPKEGRPQEYVAVGPSVIELWPTPDDEYRVRVRGWRTVEALSGAEVPIFDAEYHPAIAYLAAFTILDEEGDDSGRTDRYQDRALLFVDRMKRRYQQQADSTPIVMGGRATYRRTRWVPYRGGV